MKIILYLTAEWCQPCKQTLPIFEEVVANTENIALVIIDVEKEEDIAKELEIMKVPTMIMFEDEKELYRKFGSMDKKEVEDFVNGKY